MTELKALDHTHTVFFNDALKRWQKMENAEAQRWLEQKNTVKLTFDLKILDIFRILFLLYLYL